MSITWCSSSLDNLHGWKIELSPPCVASPNFVLYFKDLRVKVINSWTILIRNQFKDDLSRTIKYKTVGSLIIGKSNRERTRVLEFSLAVVWLEAIQ